MCPRDPLEAQRSAFQLGTHREKQNQEGCWNQKRRLSGGCLILADVRFALGLRQGGRPETRLRDFIPQTPFFASRLF